MMMPDARLSIDFYKTEQEGKMIVEKKSWVDVVPLYHPCLAAKQHGSVLHQLMLACCNLKI